jgi:hypothetical protein
MIETNHWLLIAAACALSIQGIQLGRFKPSWILPGYCLLLIVICYFSSHFIAGQNIQVWQKVANEQIQTVQIIVLLEITLALFLGCKILPISSFFSLFYGQLIFFQQGWLSFPFHWQGGFYGMGVVSLFILNFILSKVETFWGKQIFLLLGLATFLNASKLPQATSINNNWYEMAISLAVLASFITLGVAATKIKEMRTHS